MTKRKRLKRFRTGLRPLEGSMPIALGSGWTASIHKVRARLPDTREKREIVIRASSTLCAQEALNMILDAHQLLSGEPNPFSSERLQVSEEGVEVTDGSVVPKSLVKSYSTDDFPCACHIAATISRKR